VQSEVGTAAGAVHRCGARGAPHEVGELSPPHCNNAGAPCSEAHDGVPMELEWLRCRGMSVVSDMRTPAASDARRREAMGGTALTEIDSADRALLDNS
jgi:hypothetical protein